MEKYIHKVTRTILEPSLEIVAKMLAANPNYKRYESKRSTKEESGKNPEGKSESGD